MKKEKERQRTIKLQEKQKSKIDKVEAKLIVQQVKRCSSSNMVNSMKHGQSKESANLMTNTNQYPD